MENDRIFMIAINMTRPSELVPSLWSRWLGGRVDHAINLESKVWYDADTDIYARYEWDDTILPTWMRQYYFADMTSRYYIADMTSWNGQGMTDIGILIPKRDRDIEISNHTWKSVRW